MRYLYTRDAFTGIELVFVILVIGILAAVAIPKLAATRDDAKLSTDVSNMSSCIRDANSHYLATLTDFSTQSSSSSCSLVQCYKIVYATNGIDFNVTTTPEAEEFCKEIEYVGGHLVGSYNFQGSSIKR